VQVRRVPVTTSVMELSELNVKQPKTEQVRTVEASLRLDAIASAGFRISRGKAADLIKHGDVR
jgi:RNA-binding protein YlmH